MRTLLLFLAWLSLSASAFSQNLVAYYPFNGNANDQSGNAINPTYIGTGVTLTTDRFGNANKAYNFNGVVGSYMRMPADLLPTANRTISFWFNVPDVTNRPGLLGYGGSGGCGTTLLMGLNLLGSGQYYIQGHCGNNAAGYTYPAAPVNNWYHWVLTINGSAQKIYVNGQLKSTDNTFGISTVVSGRDFSLGVITSVSGIAPYTDGNVGYLNGKLDDVRIYDAAMTDAQVQNLYTSEEMVAYYPFNGNAIDETGNGNNSTYIGTGVTLTSDRFGNANKAYYFDGAVGSYIRIPADNFPTTDRTISFWFNADDPAVNCTPISYGGNGCGAASFIMELNQSGTGTYLKTGHCDAERIIVPYSTPPVNSWKQWVITINGTVQKIYINGVLQTPSLNENFNTPTYVAGRSVLLGGLLDTDGNTVYESGGPWYFKGKLDEFRIYNNPMTDAQVLSLYNDESGTPIAYYPFNGNANDESGNGNHGTVNGATLTTDRFGNADNAYRFTNPNHISVLNTNLFGDEFTLSYWFKIDSYFGQRGVMSNVAIPNGGVQQAMDGTSFSYILGYSFIGGYNPNYFYSNYTMQEPVQQWHHIVVTYKKLGTYSSETKLFINGDLKKSDVHAMPITYTPNATFYIGQNHSGLNFQGDLDDIRIYNRNLSLNEIAQLADMPVMPDLLAYLPLNGNANDMSGNSRNGTPYGGASLTTDKYDNSNSAYFITNPECGISLGNTNNLDFVGQSFAISAWVKYSNIPAADFAVIAKHNCGTPNGYVLAVNNNIPRFYLSTGGWSIISAPESYNDNKWHNLVATYDGVGSQKLYVDGELTAFATSVVYNNPSGSGAPIIIGDAAGNCGGGTFSASIDEVKIYGAALDASQVMALYKQSRGSGNAMNFDGVDDHIVTNEYLVPATGDFTVELWVYNRNINGYREFISQGGGGNAFYIGTSDITGNIRLGDTWATSAVLPLNKWVHLAVVKSGSNGALFLDGIQVATTTTYSVGAGGAQTLIGKQYGGFFEYADAILDEIRIWNTALTVGQIRDWMNRKITTVHPAFSNLVSYYNFDEKNILSAYETKGAKTGTLVNGPQYVTSGAPIGDASVSNYSNPNTHGTILSLSSGEQFEVFDPVWGLTGVNIYIVKDPPETQVGILGLGANDHYFGVHINSGGNPVSYTARYNYTGNPFVSSATEPTLQLFKRADNSATSWANSGAALNTTANTLTVTGQNTEYILGSSGFGLPVTLLSFEAKKINATTTLLNWKTTMEINNKGFQVQRSFDGNYFADIQFVNGAGNSNDTRDYSITDVPGRTGRIFYRLKQVDFDGNSKLSNIVSVFFDKQGFIKVYPNPAKQQVTIEGIDNYKKIQVLEISGKLVKEQYINGQYQVNINLDGFNSGLYLLRMVNENGSESIKLVINN